MLLVDLGEGLEGIVDSENLGVGELRHGDGGVELDLLTGAPLGGAAGACVVNKNLAHEPGGDADEVGAIFGVERPLVAQAQIGFVNESRGLERVTRALALEVIMGHGAEFAVHERNQDLQGVLVAGTPLYKQFADGMGRSVRHSLGHRGSVA